MSDVDSRRLAVPSFVPSVRPARARDHDDELEPMPAGDAERPREGLPPGFRMRHDAHYVDQLAARAPVPQVRAIPVRDIEARGTAHAHDLEPLSRSIARHGVLQPLHVRARHGRFELIAGARRLGAAALAGLTEVPCIVHACDDARAHALAEADNLRGSQVPPAEPVTSERVRQGFEELRRSFGTIASCLHLVDTRAASLRDRVALDVIRTEATRASRLVRCLAALESDPVLACRPHALRPLIEQVLEATEPERRLAGVDVTLHGGDAPVQATVDDEWFGVAIWGALGAMLAIVQGTRDAAVDLGITISATQASVAIELVQRTTRVPGSSIARFFDPHWTDRPGGYQAAIEAASARRLLTLHGGRAELATTDRGGCRLLLVVPAASA